MRLADFIILNRDEILQEWDRFAGTIVVGSPMDSLALRDHAGEILLATVRDLRLAQSRTEQAAEFQAKDEPHAGLPELLGASDLHGIGRLGSGFNLLDLVSEYRALRASVLQLWHDSEPEPHASDLDDVTRFNESIDQSLAKAVSSYTERVDQSRDLFMAILGHDLRNPLSSICMSAELLSSLVASAPGASNFVSQISADANVMTRMISDLLDFTRTRLGAGMPVRPTSMDLGLLGQELTDQFRSAHPNREIRFESAGDLSGEWDRDRLRQALSNLLGNAIQHSTPPATVTLKVNGEGPDLTIVVHNEGDPIPPGELAKIFEPLIRGSGAEHSHQNRPGSIGLGLYIARQIAESHGGSLEVTSTKANGTAFTLQLPRKCLPLYVNPS